MLVTCLDLESVLMPEIWVAVANATNEDGFRKTTRDVSDYDELMRERLELAASVGLRLRDVQRIVQQLEPLPGSLEFLGWLRTVSQVTIVSDTFYEFVTPFMGKLGWPFLFCHHIETDSDGTMTGFSKRCLDSKKAAVTSFKQAGFATVAVGDSYNDVSMLLAADLGILFNHRDHMTTEFPDLKATRTLAELKATIGSLK